MSLLKKLFGSSRGLSKITAEADYTEKMSLYIWNSNEIDKAVSGMYGAYAQGRFLQALHTVVQRLGGWGSLHGFGLVGCHGDLFDKDIFGKPTGTTILRDWVKLKSTVSIRLATDFLDKLKLDPTKVGCIPYAIGVWPIRESIAVSTHNTLLSSDVVGYLGNLSFEPNARLSFVDTRLSSMYETGMSGSDAIFGAIASLLSLPVKMGIRTSGECFGWFVPATEITKFGLSILEQTSEQTQVGQMIEEARRALKNGDMKRAILLFEELAKLTSNTEERNKYLEMAENLRKIP
jgi:hypothetical protein